MHRLEKDIARYIYEYEHPKRIALSRKFPFLKRPILFLRHKTRDLENLFDFQATFERKDEFFTSVVARHQSVLRRKLGDSSPQLQEQKLPI